MKSYVKKNRHDAPVACLPIMAVEIFLEKKN